MFELEALLLGIEPMTALAAGVGAVLLAPLVDVISDLVKDDEKVKDAGESVSNSAREATKDVMVWGLDVVENIQSSFAEAQESFNDLLAEAKEEHRATRTKSQEDLEPPKSIHIESN